MGFGRYRFRRSFGQVKSQFRGARPDTYPLTQSLLSLYPATAAYSAYDLGNKRGSVTEAEDGGSVDITDIRPESGGLVGNVTAETATGYTFDVNNEGSNGFKNFCLAVSPNTTITITFNAVLNSGSFTGVSVYAYPPTLNQPVVEGLNTFTHTSTGSATPFLYVLGTSVCNATISNIVVSQAITTRTVVNPVQRWRRSSDDALQMFTAADIADGTALDWAKRPGAFINNPVNGFDTFTNNSSGDGFYAELLSGVGIAKSTPVVGVVTDVVTVEFEIDIVSGSPSLSLRLNDQVKSNVEVVTTSGSKSIALTATASFNNFSFGEGDNPAEYTVSNIRFSTATAYLLTEYDQSGNDYDLTQTTAANQPLVVSGGALKLDDYGNVAPSFDGVNDFMTHSATVTQPFTSVSVYTATAVNSPIYGSASQGATFARRSSGEYIMFAGSVLAEGVHPSTAQIGSAVFNGASSIGRWNGTQILSGASGTNVNIDLVGSNAGNYHTGNIAATLLYDSDESANLPAIEAKLSTIVTTAIS